MDKLLEHMVFFSGGRGSPEHSDDQVSLYMSKYLDVGRAKDVSHLRKMGLDMEVYVNRVM